MHWQRAKRHEHRVVAETALPAVSRLNLPAEVDDAGMGS